MMIEETKAKYADVAEVLSSDEEQDRIDEEKDLHSRKGEACLGLIARVYDTVQAQGWRAAMQEHNIELGMIAQMYRELPEARVV